MIIHLFGQSSSWPTYLLEYDKKKQCSFDAFFSIFQVKILFKIYIIRRKIINLNAFVIL